MMKQDDGLIILTNSIAARKTRNRAGGLNVTSAPKPALLRRCFKKIAGDPSQAVSSRNASQRSLGGAERQPIKTLSPITVPGGSMALFPMKERRPIRLWAIGMNP